MACFAPVVPIAIAEQLPRDDLGYYHLLLAHDVEVRPHDYARVYCQTTAADQFIIMDNSLVELGKPCSLDTLVIASEAVNADCMVLPDILGDMRKTIGMSTEFALELRRMGNKRPLLGVVQGNSMPECFYCAQRLVESCGCKFLSVPRHLHSVLGSRMPLTVALGYKYPTVGIHLLGFSNDMIDDVSTARLSCVMGIDSAVPIRAALKGLPMELSHFFDPGPRGDYWDKALDPFGEVGIPYAIDNVVRYMTRYRNWINMAEAEQSFAA